MSLLLSDDELEGWANVLERRFIAAAQSEEEYAAGARTAHRNALKWMTNNSKIKGGFLWVCDALNLEPDAVRRAMREKAVDKLEQLRSLL